MLEGSTADIILGCPWLLASFDILFPWSFSKLDLHSAYNLIQIRKGDEWKTTFITPSGYYEYQVMPYGLANSPSVFQGFMNEVLRDMLHRFVVICIRHDILIYSRDLAEHHQHVAQVLPCLRHYHLYLKLEKCEFHHPKLHHRQKWNSNGARESSSSQKLATTLHKEHQHFLGFANFYHKFIANFSQIAMNSLLHNRPKSPGIQLSQKHLNT